MNERNAVESAIAGSTGGLDIRHALAPTMEEIKSERLGSNKEIAGELLTGKGTRALDVGCGDGRFTRLLATMFKTVDGIDINARKIEEAQKAADAGGLAISFRTGSGEALPYPDQSFDVVVFSNSLHHIPDMDRALSEAERVLVPNGLLYVMEPVPAGNYFEATKLVNDETGVRTEAYRAIEQAAHCDFVSITEVMYRSHREFSDFTEWRDDQMERGENRRLVLQARGEESRALFEQHADRSNERLAFDQVFRVNLLRKRERRS
jgi:SAM-dependent methyltransferase